MRKLAFRHPKIEKIAKLKARKMDLRQLIDSMVLLAQVNDKAAVLNLYESLHPRDLNTYEY